jgi:hypothetical protein
MNTTASHQPNLSPTTAALPLVPLGVLLNLGIGTIVHLLTRVIEKSAKGFPEGQKRQDIIEQAVPPTEWTVVQLAKKLRKNTRIPGFVLCNELIDNQGSLSKQNHMHGH